MPFEHDLHRRGLGGAHHPQTLRTGERSEVASQIDDPRGLEAVLRDGPGDDVEPLGVQTEVGDATEEDLWRAGRGKFGSDVHRIKVARRPRTAGRRRAGWD